jgi:hypothetical protein
VLTLRDLHALHLLSLLTHLPYSVDNNSGPGRRANAKPGPDQDGALAMNSMEQEPRSRYYIEAEAEDRRFAERLAAIRSREDAAAITTRQAADERIAVMEEHLEAVRKLRRQHLEGGQSS